MRKSVSDLVDSSMSLRIKERKMEWKVSREGGKSPE